VSVGKPLDQDLIVVDTSGRLLHEGQIGEIWIRGKHVAGGYWKKPDATKETFDARTATGDGPYMRTGDLGFYHEGELFISGRLKDVIILRGRNHYPQDIEQTVEECSPSIRAGCTAAFAIVVNDEERLVVVAEVDPKAPASAVSSGPEPKSVGPAFDSIIGAILSAVSVHHGVSVFAVALIAPRTIPKTSSGKIQRQTARRTYLDGKFELLAEHRDATPS
jgi:acyl-CoA synthetase (AMP-forming)/AMP-acid ligase II